MSKKSPKKNTQHPSRVLYPEPQSDSGLSTAPGTTPGTTPGTGLTTILPELLSTLLTHRRLILTAPPGAGKTTQVPPALAAALPKGKILTLQPRRVAARAIARHMAAESGQPLGQHIGYQIRHDNRTTPATRIVLMTEGLLTRKLSSDPLLEDTACVIIDEFHERSQHADLALALLRELLEVRDDFHLLVMSATLSGLVKPLQHYLGNCPHLHYDPRTHPLHIHHIDRPDDRYLDQQIRAALLRLLQADNDDEGDILVFLPGAAAISRCHRLLDEQPLPGQPDIQELFGAQSAKEQDLALSPGTRRRIVLATNLAETSLTVPGVTAVVDCGRVKRLRFDPQSGMDRLSEERVSQASADQRAGRAGRIAPGRAERLWLANEHAALALQEEAELKRVDLAPILLNLLQHQASDPRRFAFFEAPPVEAMDKALDLLRMLGALTPYEFRLSPLGRRMAALPLHPRLGRLLCDAGAMGLGETGALLCALLSEQDIRRRIAGGPYTADLENTLELWHRGQGHLGQGHRGQGHRGQGHRGQGLNTGAVRQVRAAIQQLERSLPAEQRKDSHEASPTEIRRLVLAAYPDRVGKRQAEGSRQAVLAHGRGVEIDDGGALGSSDLFIAIRADAGRR
ncbi:MAG: ATP-dependent RNA helicase, partial [Deltaproteobacteria bacterium]|nr:ATP-dependent RNA helicase [Deltaproteobacteria bacterium]